MSSHGNKQTPSPSTSTCTTTNSIVIQYSSSSCSSNINNNDDQELQPTIEDFLHDARVLSEESAFPPSPSSSLAAAAPHYNTRNSSGINSSVGAASLSSDSVHPPTIVHRPSLSLRQNLSYLHTSSLPATSGGVFSANCYSAPIVPISSTTSSSSIPTTSISPASSTRYSSSYYSASTPLSAQVGGQQGGFHFYPTASKTSSLPPPSFTSMQGLLSPRFSNANIHGDNRSSVTTTGGYLNFGYPSTLDISAAASPLTRSSSMESMSNMNRQYNDFFSVTETAALSGSSSSGGGNGSAALMQLTPPTSSISSPILKRHSRISRNSSASSSVATATTQSPKNLSASSMSSFMSTGSDEGAASVRNGGGGTRSNGHSKSNSFDGNLMFGGHSYYQDNTGSGSLSLDQYTSTSTATSASSSRKSKVMKEVEARCANCATHIASLTIHGADDVLDRIIGNDSSSSPSLLSSNMNTQNINNNYSVYMLCVACTDSTLASRGQSEPGSIESMAFLGSHCISSKIKSTRKRAHSAMATGSGERLDSLQSNSGGGGANSAQHQFTTTAAAMLDESAFVECDCCRRKIGMGGVCQAVDASTSFVNPVFYGTGTTSVTGLPFGVETMCTFCKSKYGFCTECGGGNKFRTGKYRPLELFDEGRRTCNLTHLRTGKADIQYQTFENQVDFSPSCYSCIHGGGPECDQRADSGCSFMGVINELKEMFRERYLFNYAAPVYMETIPAMSSWINLKESMSAEWKAIQQNLMLPHDPSKRRFMTLALISPPAPRRKGSKNIKISNLPSAGGDETFQTSSSAKSTTMSASPSLLPTDLHSFMSGSTAGVSATNTTNDGNNSKRKIIAGFVFGEWNVAEATMRLMQRGNRAMGGDPHSMVFDMTRCLLKRMFMMEHLERSSSNSSSSFSASATAAMMAYKSSNSSSNIPAVYRITASSPRRYMTMSTLAYQKKRMQHQEEEGGGGGVVGDVYQTLLLKQQQELVEDKEFTESDFVYARLGFVPVNDGNSSVGGIHVQEFSVLRHDLVTSTWGLSIFK